MSLSFSLWEPGHYSGEGVSSASLPLVNYFMGSFVLVISGKFSVQLISLSPLGLHNLCQNIHYTSKNSIHSSRQKDVCSGAVHGEKEEKKDKTSFRIYCVHKAGEHHRHEWHNRIWELWHRILYGAEQPGLVKESLPMAGVGGASRALPIQTI